MDLTTAVQTAPIFHDWDHSCGPAVCLSHAWIRKANGHLRAPDKGRKMRLARKKAPQVESTGDPWAPAAIAAATAGTIATKGAEQTHSANRNGQPR